MGTERDVFRSGAFAVGIAQSVVWVALGVVTLNVVPRFETIFRDFGVKLPDITIAVLTFGNFLAHYWYVALVPVLVWPFMNYVVVSLLSPRPEVVIPKSLWYMATWAAILLVVLFAVVALFLPLIVDIQSLSPAPVPPGSPPR